MNSRIADLPKPVTQSFSDGRSCTRCWHASSTIEICFPLNPWKNNFAYFSSGFRRKVFKSNKRGTGALERLKLLLSSTNSRRSSTWAPHFLISPSLGPTWRDYWPILIPKRCLSVCSLCPWNAVVLPLRLLSLIICFKNSDVMQHVGYRSNGRYVAWFGEASNKVLHSVALPRPTNWTRGIHKSVWLWCIFMTPVSVRFSESCHTWACAKSKPT